MKIALYQGTSFFPSRCIRWLTRSKYSHAAFLFDDQSEKAAIELPATAWMPNRKEGSVVEAWEPNGVRNVSSLGSQHARNTKVDIFRLREAIVLSQEKKLLSWLGEQIGQPYNFRGVLGFLTRKDCSVDNTWFCSELCFAGMQLVGRNLLSQTEPWEVPPGWIQRSPMLEYERTITT